MKKNRGSKDIITSARSEIQGDEFLNLTGFKSSHDCNGCHINITDKVAKFGHYKGESYLQKSDRRKRLLDTLEKERMLSTEWRQINNQSVSLLSKYYFKVLLDYKTLDAEIKSEVLNYG